MIVSLRIPFHILFFYIYGVYGSSSNNEKEPIIRDMVHEFSEDDEQEEYISEEQTFPTSSNHNVQSFSCATRNIYFDLSKGMSFNSKESTNYSVSAIYYSYVCC